ncbi:hypothetical protein ACEN8I_05490 [Polaromonas sp. CT11-55]|uniref:hypothetical protein n=1 Tax=Polaromonas sp. CT11-55 TaxID=3243045 RepID=UPI0039A55E30
MSQSRKHGRLRGFLGTAALVFTSLLIWSHFGYPQSLVEARFLFKLKSVAAGDVQEVNLTELMPGDWETVCDSHGYYGPLYLEKYNKTFPATGAMQDGAWGLIFIKTDGTYEPISSSCGQGAYVDFPAGCLSRDESVLVREMASEPSKCPLLKVTHQLRTEANETK